MIYRKNLFTWEQGLRFVSGVGVTAAPALMEVPMAWAWVATGLTLVVTGAFGFCPACYMVGRRAPSGRGEQHG